MTLKKLKKLKKFIKLSEIAVVLSMSNVTLISRIERNSPELSQKEAAEILAVLEKIKNDFK